jgi:hypothetical protein
MNTHLPLSSLLSFLTIGTLLFSVACNDDEVGVFEPTELLVDGPTELAPGDTATYTADRYEGATYAWAVPTPGATILSGEGTPTITVVFGAGGSGDITVAARGVNGQLGVEVKTAAPEVAVTLPNDTVLAAGATGPVRISFDQPIETTPTVGVVSATGTAAGALGALTRVDNRTFEAAYTAGTGNGTDQVSVTGAVTTAFYGSVVMDTVLFFDTYETDNTPATGELFASRTPVDSTTTSTLTVMFSEVLLTQDTVKVSVVGAAQAYVTEANMTTTDGQTWTYSFQPVGGATEPATVSVSNLPTDRAGNPTEAVDSITIEIKN